MPETRPQGGDHCGGHDLLLPIAAGGMGTVWAARRKGARGATGLLAIKTMLPRLAGDTRFQRMFRIEAEIASRIRHPNVCAILSVEHEPRQGLSLVMEWVEGSSLQTVVNACDDRDAPAPPGIVARIGAQAARGLHAAHELRNSRGERIGVVHRDVSPHNIIVSIDGVVKIIDFGIAKAVERVDNPTTLSGQIKGKVYYLSPEQARGEALDHRADIFSLGIVLYLLLTGVHPFEGSYDLATMRRIAMEPPAVAPLEAVPGCPGELVAALLRALAKEPEERFASMGDLAATLEAVAARCGVGDVEVGAFVREMVGERIAARAAKIEEAARVQDEVTAPAPREAAPAPREATPAPGEAVAAGAAPVRPRRALLAAALCVIGLALGAAVALAWLVPERPGDSAATTLESAGLAAPPVAAFIAPAEPATARSAAPLAPSAAPLAPAAVPARSDPRSRFREPGF
jgi:serine/threonine-protein kinase